MFDPHRLALAASLALHLTVMLALLWRAPALTREAAERTTCR
jgi:hypothetical protein